MTNEAIARSAADRKEIDYTVGTLNATVNAILNELDRSTVEVKFPQPVDFNGNSLDSVSSSPRASLPPKETDSLVEIYHGPKLTRR